MTAAEQEAFCRQFALGEAVRCEAAGGTRNRNFILETTRGRFFIRKRFAGYSSPAQLAFDHHAMEFLQAAGVAVAVPRCWTSGDGVWEVFPVLPGRHLRDGDENDVRRLGKALTEFHRAGRSFEERFEKIGPRGETDPGELRALCEQMSERTDAVQPYLDWIDAAERELSDSKFAALPHTLVHGDVQPANVLVDGERIAFVDFDWCAWRPRVYDLAFAILLCCSRHAEPIRGEDIWSLSQPAIVQRDLLRSFRNSCAGTGWPLSGDEMAAMRPQILLSWCSVRLAGAGKVESSRWHEFLSRPPHDSRSLWPDDLS